MYCKQFGSSLPDSTIASHDGYSATLAYCKQFGISLPDSTITPHDGYSATLANAPPSVRASGLAQTRKPFAGAATLDFILEFVGRIPPFLRLCALSGCVAPCWPDSGSLYYTPDHAEIAITFSARA